MFQRLRKLQAFEQKHFPYLQSPLDSVLIAEIGYHQEQGRPLTIKGLLLLKLGAPATVRRRLQRLVGLGLVHKRRVSHDRRICYLEIDSVVRTTYAKYLKLISRL
jgi:DNA-binding MarR family transcriptional regulator